MKFKPGQIGNPLGIGGFKKGQVANPGGRPKKPAEWQEAGKAAFDKLLWLMDNAKDEALQAKCANDILDRTYGRPVQQTAVDSKHQVYLVKPDRKAIEEHIGMIDVTPLTEQTEQTEH